jgi:hypothetical protein
MTFKNYNRTGLSLIEVLVAASIFIIGLMAMLSASVALLSATRFSKNYLIATGLAREAVEIVKNKRDENYLLGNNFNNSLKDINFAIIEFDDQNPNFDGRFKIVEITDNIDDCVTNKTCQLKFFPSKNLYGSGTVQGDNGEPVSFYRLLTFENILCQTGTVPEAWIYTTTGDPNTFVCTQGEIIGLQATATVKWYDKQLQFLEITNKFYDWR